MAPLSMLPGRLRLESALLRGRRDLCRGVECRLLGRLGVVQASANFRTGRILVRYDEAAVTREEVAGFVEDLLLEGKLEFSEAEAPVASPGRGGQESSSHITRHVLAELVTHALLPSPFDLLLPSAMAALRR